MPTRREPQYSERFDEALRFAAEQFRFRIRKGSSVPYITHLLQVCTTVGEHGGDEEQMIAALLHDYLEDIEDASEEVLASRFGERVARLVRALSDSIGGGTKEPWRIRKEAYVAAVRVAPAEVKLICTADKLHNARSVCRDQHKLGDGIFDRFTATKAQTLWYYRAIYDALADGFDEAPLSELDAAIDEMHRLAGAPRTAAQPEAPDA